MGLQPIPTPWCQAVCAALRKGGNHARFTFEGGQRWQNEHPDAFRYAIDDAFIRALSTGTLRGCFVQMTDPPGDTWEFFFEFTHKRLYGKILLKTDRKNVVIFSAHRPDKPTLRCE